MKKILGAIALTAAAVAAGAANAAEGFPNQPIRIVVPYQAGGGTDQVLRIVAPQVSALLGQPIIILNRPGASTVIGMKEVIAAKPDGYTLALSTNTSYSLIPYTQSPQPYDPEKTLEYITALGETPLILTTHPGFSRNFPEFIAKVKQSPGAYSYATYGVGGITHLAAEVLMGDMGIKLNQVPYKGFEAVTAVAGGQVDAMVDGVNSPTPMIQAGKIIPLVTLQHTRTKFLPNTPTLTEIGYPNASTSTISYILAAPKGTPQPVIDKLYQAFSQVMGEQAIIEKIEQTKSMPMHMTPAQTKAYIDAEAERFRRIIVERKITFN
ncbi:Bug family tripartite tricarboxylate transporter substrate binding protein [Bordetella bronchiseptica]|uniref:Bug family tripartite tricarboxylate transporter substrate binding protein n=1 Tax=Bordetella bronchiseptica TaxID=518 RepID=UPI000460B2F4|nr:tripartite tricarboxylate transporter substrate binding protein [Bordetella bronchiseptica]KDD15845.1 tripartite tricarboxylate transporter family receptor [Bordetella bronchiseptica MBORD707]